VTWNTIVGLVDGTVDESQYDPKIVDFELTSDDGNTEYGFTGYGLKISATDINGNGNDGRTDASEYYTFSEDKVLDVNEILSDLIIIVSPDENPDGRAYNTRPNGNGFDLNRDASNQTQAETRNIGKLISVEPRGLYRVPRLYRSVPGGALHASSRAQPGVRPLCGSVPAGCRSLRQCGSGHYVRAA